MKKYFITAISTDSGKTLVSAILTNALQADYWKPIQAGVEETDSNTIRKFLQEFEGVEVLNVTPGADDKVIVKQGILMNYKGIVLEVIGNKARVNIESMGLQLSALFDVKNLEVLR